MAWVLLGSWVLSTLDRTAWGTISVRTKPETAKINHHFQTSVSLDDFDINAVICLWRVLEVHFR